jgi:RNA polymerase sigma factor (sigma-70 family)
MSSIGSVTNWITLLKAGDRDAAQQLWERYHRRLVGLARKRLYGSRRRAADESDVVQSAFDSFFRGFEQGRFPRLSDRNDLWRLLVIITARKAIDLVQREKRPKRGGGKVAGESALPLRSADDADAAIEQVVGHEPTPEFAVQVAEECQRLLDRLGDEQLCAIAVWKMEGYTNEEIGRKLDCAPVTVERRLKVIRKLWEE